jgi:hypothetical protein
MKPTSLLIVLLMTLGALACNDTTPAGERSPEATANPTNTAVDGAPLPPADFDAYPQTVADYLTAHPNEGAGLACLSKLFDAWDMPYFSGERSCRAGNTDDDPENEVAAVLVDREVDGCGLVTYRVIVLDRGDAEFSVAWASAPAVMNCDAVNEIGNVILATEDINGDGQGDISYGERWCGAHTCGVTVYILTGTRSGYRSLTSEDGYRIETPRRVELVDTDEDGTKELILSGGAIQSVASGPGVLRVDTYGWNGSQYVLRSSVPD